MAPSREIGERPNGNGSTDRLLGELIAEVRTVKHNQNNTSTKVDVATQGTMREDVEELKREVKDLVQEKHRREGAIGLVEWIGRHWPFIVLVLGLGAWVGWANGLIK